MTSFNSLSVMISLKIVLGFDQMPYILTRHDPVSVLVTVHGDKHSDRVSKNTTVPCTVVT